jgi:hypothetical protein
MPEHTLLDMIIDRLEAGLPVTVYILQPSGTAASTPVTGRTLGVTTPAASGGDDVTPPCRMRSGVTVSPSRVHNPR